MRLKPLNSSIILYGVWVAIMLLFAFYPAYFNEISFINKIDIYINLTLVFFIGMEIIKTHRSNLLFMYILLYTLISLIITIVKLGNIANVIWGNGILLLILMWGMYKYYHTNPILFEKVTYKLMYLLILINLITVFLFPQGLIVDTRGISSTNFFLGNYNSYIQYLILTILSGYLYYMHTQGRIPVQWYLIFIVGFVFYWKKFSATSCLGLSIILIYHIMLNRNITRWFLNLKVYISVNVIFFVAFVWSSGNTGILAPILKMFHKDFTFTGRTEIWTSVKNLISASPFWGIGTQSMEVIAEKIGLIQAVNAHNLYLNIWLTAGGIGILIFMLILFYTAHKITKIKNNNIRYFLEMILGTILFMAQFEAYTIKFFFFLMMLLCLYVEETTAHGKEIF